MPLKKRITLKNKKTGKSVTLRKKKKRGSHKERLMEIKRFTRNV